jgi:hypothetical protein
MSSQFPPGANLYTQGFGSRPENVEVPHLDVRAPSQADIQYPVGKHWVDTVGNAEYVLTSFSSSGNVTTANWQGEAGGSVSVETLSGDTGTAMPAGGNIKLAGTANQVHTVASGSTVTFSLIGPYTPATYTAHGVLIGEGTGSIVATTASSDGQVLTGNTGADPTFDAIGTKSGLTAHGVLLAEGAGAFVATAAPSDGLVLNGNTGADPSFNAIGTKSGLTGLVVGNGASAFTTTTYTPAGAFTPAFALATPGDSAWTYSAQFGRYNRVGAIVYFTATLTWTNFTNSTGSGTWQVNLPVAAGAFVNAGQVAISGSGINAGAQTAALPANFLGVVTTGATSMILSVELGGAANATSSIFNLTVTQVLTTGTLNITGFYFAA